MGQLAPILPAVTRVMEVMERFRRIFHLVEALRTRVVLMDLLCHLHQHPEITIAACLKSSANKVMGLIDTIVGREYLQGAVSHRLRCRHTMGRPVILTNRMVTDPCKACPCHEITPYRIIL